MDAEQPPLFPGYEPVVTCLCGHPDPPPGQDGDPRYCQHARFRAPHATDDDTPT